LCSALLTLLSVTSPACAVRPAYAFCSRLRKLLMLSRRGSGSRRWHPCW
jgi:hypothetical protein